MISSESVEGSCYLPHPYQRNHLLKKAAYTIPTRWNLDLLEVWMMKKWLWLSFILAFSSNIFAAGFPAGSLVKTSEGYSQIEDIKAGDFVVTCNLKDTCEEKEVVATRTEVADSLVAISVGDIEIKVSPDHLFFVPDESKWVQARNLGICFELLTASHQIVRVDEVLFFQNLQPETLYDLSVADNHNFYVSEKDILTHNFAFIATIVAPFVAPAIAPVVGGVIIATTVFHALKFEIEQGDKEKERRRARAEQERINQQAREQEQRANAKLKSLQDKSAQQFVDEIKKLPPGERVAAVKEVASAKAKKYGWGEKNKNLSKKNNRDIYTDKDGNHWSVDTQHGTFEKLNKRGKHQGEYNVDLDFNEGSIDPSGGHDIQI